MFVTDIKRDNPCEDYLDYIRRSCRTGRYTMLDYHLTLLSKETALSYGVTIEQYDQLTAVLESGV